MSNRFSPDNLHKILDGLKGFQRQTVEYVFQRLYTDPDITHRFLIADEVGLGKTLVARGVIARALEHLWGKTERLDIVYICSNADIARQNINRLNITGQPDFALASRITLLPTQIHNLQGRPVNFVSFTPSTSFDLKSGMGRADERVLLYWLLQDAWGFRNAASYNVLQGDMGSNRFRSWVHYFDRTRIEKSLKEKFIAELGKKPVLREQFDELCDIYRRADSIVSFESRQKRSRWIGDVRDLLARSCLTALEPDLIILDEFQRFKHLLDNESEDSELARHLFNYSSEHAAARVILLSATPYKMYTLANEESDDHYQDFVQTLKFLFNDPEKTSHLEKIISEYRQEVFRLRDGRIDHLRDLKQELERTLRRVMVRTERLASSEDRDGMLVQVTPASLPLAADDLQAYVGLAKIAEEIEQPVPLEYWKSVPYLLNFMDNYDFKAEFEAALDDPERADYIANMLAAYPQALLSIRDIENYSQFDPGNARLRSLLFDTVESGAWRALWLPPAAPYYRVEGVFADPSLSKFTKRLVFSSWRVVPKAISIFLSYEAERLMFKAFEKDARNTKRARERRRPLLRFAQGDGRLTGLPVLGLIYPSMTLAKKIDPLQVGAHVWNDGLPTLNAVVEEVQRKIHDLLGELSVKTAITGIEDERWYWAAPMLLDAHYFPKFTQEWWQLHQDSTLAEEWGNLDEDPAASTSEEATDTHWGKHVEEAQKLITEFFNGRLSLGRVPADLEQVLTQFSLAGLGVVSLRSLLRVSGEPDSIGESKTVTINAARISKSFLFIFNLPETMALIRSLNRDEPYWRRVLEYGMAGCLQAVMDEYVHMLHESLGLQDASPADMSEALMEHICNVLTYRTSTPSIDSIEPSASTPVAEFVMRSRFAMRFGDEKNDGGVDVTRADRVRSAFNSPFWPFVLATTSIGQEGLDFHNYCHAVVHWNLPANPVDLEQREGRVHRYKGHAVRKNLAQTYLLPKLVATMRSETDLWKVLFQLARQEQSGEVSDLVPFWIYQKEGGAKIERHVPALPLSRDRQTLDALQRSLAVYRMVFGQNRQEDLLTYLLSHFSSEHLQALMGELRIDLAPPH